MNGEIEEEAPRPRPLSSGIWSLFSWLRRTDRSSSSESVGSVGSDLTVSSFDFLAPLNYKHNPALELPQSPSTDTYKKRLNERNLRRQYDRNITLRRKYGLYREEVSGFDGFSLPPAKKTLNDSPSRRDRRAVSESFQRRAPYVPGKRRAPLPPRVIISNTLPRSYKRKRQAPKPPINSTEENKENVDLNKNKQMNSNATSSKYSIPIQIAPSSQKLENNIKENVSKDIKLRPEKSFLKQLFFDNRKRNSAIDTSHVKWLPSISELDKQAAEIIAAKKMANNLSKGDNNIGDDKLVSSKEKMWICKICFRQYNASVESCLYCVKSDKNASNIYTQTDKNIATSSKHFEDNEKKKLKEMLKEMKDSLPKRPKHNEKKIIRDNNNASSTETPTLRIGSPMDKGLEITSQVKQLPSAILPKQKSKLQENKMLIEASNTTSQPSGSKQIIVSCIFDSSKPIDKKKDMDEKNTEYNSYNNVQMPILDSRKYNFLMASKPKDTSDLLVKVPNNDSPEQNSKKISNNTKQLSLANIVTTTGNCKNIIDQRESASSGLHFPNYEINTETTTSVNSISKKPSNTKEISTKSVFNNSNIKCKTKSYLTDHSKINLVAPTYNTTLLNKNIDLSQNKQLNLGDVILPTDTNSIESKVLSNVNLNTPLRISSLLNPLYMPKQDPLSKSILENNFSKILQSQPDVNNKAIVNITVSPAVAPSTSERDASDFKKSENIHHPDEIQANKSQAIKKFSKIGNLNQHAKRRDLINQLESAISKGDEKSASEAAANLAKLKLSCSVLSFSSQIVGLVNNTHDNGKINENATLSSKPASLTKMNSNKEVRNQQSQLATISESTTEQNPRPSTSKQSSSEEMVPIEVWVEDKEAARGPIRMQVRRKAIMGDLKKQAETSLGLDIRLQRWIVGKNLCTDDYVPLVSLAGSDFNAPFYLCLVESGTNKDEPYKINEISEVNYTPLPNIIKKQESGNVYTDLMKLEQQALVPNTEDFECGVCIEQCEIGNGVVLRECIHTFCRECLSDIVRHSEEPTVSCPAIGCHGTLQEREIRALLPPDEYDRWLTRSLTAVESGTRNTFHCRTTDCTGWAFCEPGVRRFPCPVCKHTNCLPCQAVHEEETCEQYQAKIHRAAAVTGINQTDEGTQALLESLIKKGEALECPECSAIITKKWGCDWIKCSSCKTEICWVTKGRRWGPAGKGDTSGGCKCGVDGKRCHPTCGYCH